MEIKKLDAQIPSMPDKYTKGSTKAYAERGGN